MALLSNIVKNIDRLIGKRFYIRGATAAINDTTLTDVITAAAAAAVNTGTNPRICLTDVWVCNSSAATAQTVALNDGTTAFLRVGCPFGTTVHVKPTKPIVLAAGAKFSATPLASATSTFVSAQGFVTSAEDDRVTVN